MMAKETEMRMNIVAIKRVDPYVKDIIESSAHVALYTFNAEKNEWEKTDIEGALFIYSRNAEPFNSIFINNRLNTNSLVEPITRFELQSQPPFLLYRNERSKIRGFWFYSKSECDRIGDLISKLVKDTQTKEQKSTKSSKTISTNNSNSNNNNNVNILSMLSKAQEDFNKVTNVTTPVSKENNGFSNMALNNPSVMSFFGAIPAELQRIKPSVVPPVHTVDEIEKKHRATTPQNEPLMVIANGSKSLRTGSPDGHGANVELGSSPLVTFFNSVNLGNQTGLNKKPFPIVNAKAVSEIEQEQTRPMEKHNDFPHKSTAVNNLGSKPALMPPTMFETSGKLLKAEDEDDVLLKPVAPLTKDQMVTAMTYLMKNDSSFVNKLHEAYLKSIGQ